MNHLMHVTINTAHMFMHPLNPLPEAVTQALLPLVLNGNGELPEPLSGYTINICNADKAWLITVNNSDSHSVVTFGIALDSSSADRLWPIINNMQVEFKSFMPRPVTRPNHLPWLATLVWPTAMAIPVSDISLMANMQQCIASLLIELDGNQGS